MDEKSFTTRTTKTSADVIDFYEQYAESWDSRFGNQLSVTEFHRIRLKSFLSLADIKKTDTLVELGVGTGQYLEDIAPLAAKVICIDGSEEMLRVLNQKHSQIPNIEVLQQDLACPQKYSNIQADVIYCFGLVEHVTDINTFIENCRSMCRKGGRVIFVSTNGLSPWYTIMRKIWRAGRHCTTDTYYTKPQLDKIMKDHLFTPSGAIYWGYFPAGISDFGYRLLSFAGKIVDKTILRQYAGGLTVSYLKE